MASQPLVYSEAEVLKLLGVNRSTFKQSLRPLMESVGDARKIGQEWAYPSVNLWQWKVYVATRRNLIEAGEWNSKRPYSIQDMEDIALVGMYEDHQPEVTNQQQTPPSRERVGKRQKGNIMTKLTILEWKQKCNCSSGEPQYEIEGEYRQNTHITKDEAVRLVESGTATVRHAVDSAIDYAEDFDQERDYVPGPYLTK